MLAAEKITVEEFLQMEFEGEDAYYELINGQVVKKTGFSPLHQHVCGRLSSQLFAFIERGNLGKAFYAPADVRLDQHNQLLPDIFFIRAENTGIIDYQLGVFGVPDLVVEIISPSSILTDRVDKKAAYENTGVREYWLIDPQNRSVEIYQNRAGHFEPVGFAVEAGKVASLVLPGFEVETVALFPANL